MSLNKDYTFVGWDNNNKQQPISNDLFYVVEFMISLNEFDLFVQVKINFN
jgi:hypothetical protein